MRRRVHSTRPDRAAMTDAVTVLAERFTELAVAAPNPEAAVPATPPWSVTDVFGHVAMEPARYRELALGRGNWPSAAADLPAFNAEQVRTLPTRNLDELATILRRDTAALLTTVAEFGDDPPTMNFDGNQRVRADRALGTLLAEFVIHGHDIARAIGSRWPIDPAHVPLILQGMHQVMPGWVNPAKVGRHTATYELRLRGHARHIYAFHDGALTIDPADAETSDRPIDVHLSAEPVSWLLASYGRINQLRPTLTGKIIAWGRRPWLAASFARRFLSP